MKNNYQGLISVIIPTYNWPAALEAVLVSLLSQKDRNFEVIIVDDGSTSETRLMVEGFKNQYQPFFKLSYLWLVRK